MKVKIFVIFLTFSIFFNFTNVRAQLIISNGTLAKVTGNLAVFGNSSSETYEAYFHIPIPSYSQVPILIEVDSPNLIDYRFIRMNPSSVIIAAQMKQQTDSTNLDWTAWLIVKKNRYSNYPSSVQIPNLNQLPDSVKKWLNPSDCVQCNEPIIRQKAESIRGSNTNLIELADDICDFCFNIPWWESWPPPHLPLSFDAIHALKWGNSCTGHAHVGAALFRANGIPARVVLDIPFNKPDLNADQHWIIEYFVPGYGWVQMETSTGKNPFRESNQIVTFVCNPEDEFPVFHPWGNEGLWHTSDPALILAWGQAHNGRSVSGINDSISKIELASSLTNSVFNYYSQYWGINLSSVQQTVFQNAFNYQESALKNIQDKDIDNYIINMQNALDNYKIIDIEQITTIFFDDFENELKEWTHGGTQDEWELGVPKFGLTQAYSGQNCWCTDMDNTYENNANCWLKSPPIDLTQCNCAYLCFWLWNWVEDINYGPVGIFDKIWLDITSDGTNFYPLCSQMGGVNDDPEIPDIGGWSRIVLDLTKYVGTTIQVRFRFESDEDDVQYGSHIDDVHVYGRKIKELSVFDNDSASPKTFVLFQNYPNPFNPTTTISFELYEKSNIKLTIYNITGKEIKTVTIGEYEGGHHKIIFNAENLPSGLYFYKLKSKGFEHIKKMILLR